MQTCCTIVTAGYLPLAKVLHYSLKKFDANILLQVLVIGETEEQSQNNFNIHNIGSLENYPLVKELESRYAYLLNDKFRWAMKPVFISYLLEKGFDKVIYIDPDIHFFHDFKFLFTELEKSPVLLSPHWRDTDPLKDEENFIALYKDGLYNAGFIGVSSKGFPAIKWWASLCQYKMDQQPELGIYDDQRYLDAMPIKFPETMILQHPGCNIAKWNINECRRENKDGQILINGEYPIIFIHFTGETIHEIKNGVDKQLQPFLEEYEKALAKENINVSGIADIKNKNLFRQLKEKTLIRTRIKRFIYKLSQKL